MTDFESRLDSVWREDLPPARDALFRLAVQARMERRRFRIRMAAVGAFGLIGSVLLWFLTAQAVALVGNLDMAPGTVITLSLLLAASAGGMGLFQAARAL